MANPIGSLFGGHTPFVGMQEHMRVVHRCVQEVNPMFAALVAGDQEAVAAHAKKISEIEDEADLVKNEIRSHLPRSLFMPVDRRDFLEMLDLQDSIADSAEDIADVLLVRHTEVPEAMASALMTLTRRCVDVVNLTHDLIENLDELLAVGFRGRTAGKVEAMVLGINKVESETDALGAELTRILFTLEPELGAVSVLLWFRQIELIGDLADYAEKLANRLRLIIAT